MLVHGAAPKMIADELEISAATVNVRINGMVAKAGLQDRRELSIQCLQQSNTLVRGGICTRGLHKPGCACASMFCAWEASRKLAA